MTIPFRYCAAMVVLTGLAAGLAVGGAPATGPATAPSTRPAIADNSYCFACHANYAKEKLARRHQLAGVGCVRCHGESDKHSSDEDNITAPDVMFAREKVNGFCVTCHAPEKLRQAKPDKHEPVLAGTAREQRYCTDCHGQHALAVRTRKWDKATGKLISDDGVRMTGPQGK